MVAAVTAESLYAGAVPAMSSGGPTGSVVMAGGMDYVEPTEPRDPRLCPAETPDGSLCRAYKRADTGLCVGHSER